MVAIAHGVAVHEDRSSSLDSICENLRKAIALRNLDGPAAHFCRRNGRPPPAQAAQTPEVTRVGAWRGVMRGRRLSGGPNRAEELRAAKIERKARRLEVKRTRTGAEGSVDPSKQPMQKGEWEGDG
jgi:hypothetical protein